MTESAKPSIYIQHASSAHVDVFLPESFSDETLARVWNDILQAMNTYKPQELIIDGSKQSAYTGSTISLLVALRQKQEHEGRKFTLKNISKEYEKLFNNFFSLSSMSAEHTVKKKVQRNSIATWGMQITHFVQDCYNQLVFTGELTVMLVHAIRLPRIVRWNDVCTTIESGGIAAMPIILALNFLMGVIMAFQSAIPMRQFGADVFVADLVALSLVRELGPLMTAIILAGRSGAAFAAEIGTMKVNQEIDALTTMGLNPVRFLVLSRIIAVLVFVPVLTIFGEAAGIIGGACVFKGLGYPLVIYIDHIMSSVRLCDFMGGFIKACVFGLLVAAIGCLRGLQTTTGARAVGESTTSAVVSGLVLIVLADGLFSVLYYFLGV